MPTIAIYAGARTGAVAEHSRDARNLGRCLASRGCRVVYGGSPRGLMGEVARGALECGGAVVGVTTPHIMEMEDVNGLGMAQVLVRATLAERRQTMLNMADAIIALPGGIGTLDELTEVWSASHLRLHSKPLFMLNSAGFWSPLMAWMSNLEQTGFVRNEPSLRPSLVADVHELVELLLSRLADGFAPSQSQA